MLSKITIILLGVLSCAAQVKEDLGATLQEARLGASQIARMGNDEIHYFGMFDYTSESLFDVNMTTGTSRVAYTGLGGLGANMLISSHNHKAYFVTGDPCYLFQYDADMGVLNRINDPSWSSYGCGIVDYDKSAQSSIEGAAGHLFFGTSVRGTVFQYDTNTGTITDYGVISAPPANPTCVGCYRYVYSIQADANYVYVGMRDASTDEYWLTILKLANSSQTDCFVTPKGTGMSGVYRRKSDEAVVYDHLAGGVHTYYLMPTDGTCPSTVITPAPTSYAFWEQRVGASGTSHKVVFSNLAALAVSDYNVDIDLTDINASTATSGLSTFRYRNPAGSGAYVTKTGLITMYDLSVKIAKQAAASDALMIVAGTYGTDLLQKVSDGTKIDAGKPVAAQSTYGLVWDAGSAAWYLAGYSASVYRYDPAVAWGVTPGNVATECSVASPTNPCSVNTGLWKYPYYNVVGSDGLIYTISRDERSGKVGGGFRWYNPTTHATGTYRDGPPSVACYDPHGVASINAGATIAYSGSARTDVPSSCAETVGKIFLFDVATQTIPTVLTPIAAHYTVGTLTALPNDHLMGVLADYPSAGHYTIYSINPATDTLDWSITGTAVVTVTTTGAPAVGPDGYVYLYIGNNLTRLHPLTGALETAYADSTAHGGMSLVTGPFGSAMYLWGSTHLYRINLWRPASFSVRNSQSTATQIRLKYGRTTTLDATAVTQACAYEALCTVAIPGHVIGDMYYQWQFLTAGNAVVGASDVTKVTLN